ncbi:MAG: hypothetical protein F6J93_25000 [Oscillatoria sp. SIO1A7]|nr:hypothetical protein [Oscillatoria sp. SIO1A7]
MRPKSRSRLGLLLINVLSKIQVTKPLEGPVMTAVSGQQESGQHFLPERLRPTRHGNISG